MTLRWLLAAVHLLAAQALTFAVIPQPARLERTTGAFVRAHGIGF